ELEMLSIPHQGLSPDVVGEVQPLLGEMRFVRVQQLIDSTEVPPEVGRYLVRVVRRTREVPGVTMGASPRATMHLQGAAKATARLDGRSSATIDDVRSIAQVVLAHRLLVEGTTPQSVVADALAFADATV